MKTVYIQFEIADNTPVKPLLEHLAISITLRQLHANTVIIDKDVYNLEPFRDALRRIRSDID